MKSREENLGVLEETMGFVPKFATQSPDLQLDIDSKRWNNFMLADTKLTQSEKAIISLSAASALNGHYSAAFSREWAQNTGWSNEQLYDAVAAARDVNYYTTWLHGRDVPIDEFKKDVDRLMPRLEQLASEQSGQPLTQTRPDNQSRDQINAEIENTFGFIPAWLSDLPDTLFIQDWIELSDWGFSPSPLEEPIKNLCGLAAAAAAHCPYCNYFYLNGARAAGCSEEQIIEALCVARLIAQNETELVGTEYPIELYKQESHQMWQQQKAA